MAAAEPKRGSYETLPSNANSTRASQREKAKNPGQRKESDGLLADGATARNNPAVAGNAPGAPKPRNNRFWTTFLVINYMIGSGVLNTPQTVKESGIAATAVLYILACLAVWWGSVVLVKAAVEWPPSPAPGESKSIEGGGHAPVASSVVETEEHNFATLASSSLGAAGPKIVDSVIAVQNAGALLSYVIILGGLVTALADALAMELDQAETWWDNFYVLTPLVVVLVVLVPASAKDFTEIKFVALWSFLTIVTLLISVIVHFASPAIAHLRSHAGDPGERQASATGGISLDEPLLWWNWMGFFRKAGSVVFGLTFAPAAFHAYNPMEIRDLTEWKAVVTMSVAVGGGMCYAMGLFGYLSFGKATSGDILENFSGRLGAVLKACVILHLGLYIPGEGIVLRDSIFGVFGWSKEIKWPLRVGATFVMLAVILVVVMLLTAFGVAQGDLFGYILDFVGGVSAPLTSFVFPAIVYLKKSAGSERDKYRTASKVLLIFGSALMICVLGSMFHSIVVALGVAAVVSAVALRNRWTFMDSYS